jgi:hypothetical protein
MWIDADLIFLDMNLRIEQVAASYPKAHILISAENHGSTTLINSGSILIKNSKGLILMSQPINQMFNSIFLTAFLGSNI